MKNITVAELAQRIQNGEQLNIVDVREAHEYEADNIGATLVPLSDIRNFEADAIEHLKDQEIILHCKSGVRSMEAGMLLKQMGFADVYNLTGGITEWRSQLGDKNIK